MDRRTGEADAGHALRTLAHGIDIEWLKEAHARVRKDGAQGVDRQTAEDN
jgi:hypothetical protein